MSVLSWLFDPTPGTPSLWYVGLTALAVLVVLGCLLAYAFRRSLYPGHALNIRLTARMSVVGLLLGVLALIFVAARYLAVAFFEMRLWLTFSGLLIAAYAGYVAYFLRRRYPVLLAGYKTEQNRLRYIKPVRATGGGGGQRRSKKRRR